MNIYNYIYIVMYLGLLVHPVSVLLEPPSHGPCLLSLTQLRKGALVHLYVYIYMYTFECVYIYSVGVCVYTFIIRVWL